MLGWLRSRSATGALVAVLGLFAVAGNWRFVEQGAKSAWDLPGLAIGVPGPMAIVVLVYGVRRRVAIVPATEPARRGLGPWPGPAPRLSGTRISLPRLR